MNTEQLTPDVYEPSYRSGIAARLAGIPVETLRVWERRYQVTGPAVSPKGHRLYSAEDVSRLAVIKHMVDLGSAVGSIANLPLAALHEMRSSADAASRGMSSVGAGFRRPIRVALAGGALSEQIARDSAPRSTLEIVVTGTDVTGAKEALGGISADVLVIELPTLQRESLAVVDALVQAVGARHAVIAYRFGPSAIAGALRNRGHTVTRTPLDPDELERLCREATATDSMQAAPRLSTRPLDTIPERRFDDPTLARFARSLTTLYCECPRHIADLLIGIGTFERYSAECANRGPEDAVLHQYLERVAGSARAMFEEALVRIAQAEGIAIPVETGK